MIFNRPLVLSPSRPFALSPPRPLVLSSFRPFALSLFASSSNHELPNQTYHSNHHLLSGNLVITAHSSHKRQRKQLEQ